MQFFSFRISQRDTPKRFDSEKGIRKSPSVIKRRPVGSSKGLLFLYLHSGLWSAASSIVSGRSLLTSRRSSPFHQMHQKQYAAFTLSNHCSCSLTVFTTRIHGACYATILTPALSETSFQACEPPRHALIFCLYLWHANRAPNQFNHLSRPRLISLDLACFCSLSVVVATCFPGVREKIHSLSLITAVRRRDIDGVMSGPVGHSRHPHTSHRRSEHGPPLFSAIGPSVADICSDC